MRLPVTPGLLFANILMLMIARATTGRQIRVRCAPPDAIANGSYRIRRNGMLMRVACKEGFVLQGPRVVDCIHGKWFGNRPVCAKKGCATTSLTAENGQVQIENELKAVLFCSDAHNLAGNRFAYCNGTHWDRQLGNCRARTENIEQSCDFESEDVCGWVYENNDNYGWRRVMAANVFTTFRTGPRHDHTTRLSNGGHYMLMESVGSGRDGAPVVSRLMSPIYEQRLSLRTACCFRFFYFMYGSDVGTLSVFLRPVSVALDEMLAQTDLYVQFSKSGNQNNLWNEAQFSIEKMAEDFQIVFMATGGRSHLSDIAIDDVKLMPGGECSRGPNDASDDLATTTTDLPILYDVQSCTSRCSESSGVGVMKGRDGQLVGFCNCHTECEDDDSCCPDYRAVCLEDMFAEIADQSTTQEYVETTTNSTTRLPTSPTVVSPKITRRMFASTPTVTAAQRQPTTASLSTTVPTTVKNLTPTTISRTTITPQYTTKPRRRAGLRETSSISSTVPTATASRTTAALRSTRKEPVDEAEMTTLRSADLDRSQSPKDPANRQTTTWFVYEGVVEGNDQNHRRAHGAKLLNLVFVLLGSAMVLGAVWYRCEPHLLPMIAKCSSAEGAVGGGAVPTALVTAKFKMEVRRDEVVKSQTMASTLAQSRGKQHTGSRQRRCNDDDDDTSNLLCDEADLDFIDFTLQRKDSTIL